MGFAALAKNQIKFEQAPYWKSYCDFFEQTYSKKWEYLMDLNLHLINGIMGFLKIDTSLIMASSLNTQGLSD